MYLAVNLPRHIATLGGILLLTSSCTIIHLLKCKWKSPLPPYALAGPSDMWSFNILETSYSLNLAICFNRSLLETVTSWVYPYPSYFRGGQFQNWRRAST